MGSLYNKLSINSFFTNTNYSINVSPYENFPTFLGLENFVKGECLPPPTAWKWCISKSAQGLTLTWPPFNMSHCMRLTWSWQICVQGVESEVVNTSLVCFLKDKYWWNSWEISTGHFQGSKRPQLHQFQAWHFSLMVLTQFIELIQAIMQFLGTWLEHLSLYHVLAINAYRCVHACSFWLITILCWGL